MTFLQCSDMFSQLFLIMNFILIHWSGLALAQPPTSTCQPSTHGDTTLGAWPSYRFGLRGKGPALPNQHPEWWLYPTVTVLVISVQSKRSDKVTNFSGKRQATQKGDVVLTIDTRAHCQAKELLQNDFFKGQTTQWMNG